MRKNQEIKNQDFTVKSASYFSYIIAGRVTCLAVGICVV